MTAPQDSTFPPAAPKSASVWEDFVDIFTSPSEVFERRRDSGFGIPLLVYGVVTALLLVLGRSALEPIFDAEFARSMAAAVKANPQAAANMDAARGIAGKVTTGVMVVGPFVIPLIVGLVTWIASKFVGAKEDLSQACMIATYALIPRILDTALRVGQAFFMDPAALNGQARVSLSAGRFFDPDTTSAGLIAVLSRIDVFTIWSTILIGIGISVVARIPRARGLAAAAIVWVIATLPALFQALRAG